jgi:DNA polymerase III alpha subunit
MSDLPVAPVLFISFQAIGWLVSVLVYLRILHADHPGAGIGFPELSRIFLLLVFWPFFLPYVLLLRLEHWLRARHLLTVQQIHAQMQVLLHAGAFDHLLEAHSPAARYWLVEQSVQQPRGQLDEEPDQLEFDFAADVRGDPAPPIYLPAIPQRALDIHSWNAMGVVPRAHPFVMWDLPAKRRWWCQDVQPGMERRTITMLAWVITSKQVLSTQTRARDGSTLEKPSIRPMAFVTLEDEHGIAESVWFPEVYHAYGAAIDAGKPFWVTGVVMVEYGVATLEVTRVASLPADGGPALPPARMAQEGAG